MLEDCVKGEFQLPRTWSTVLMMRLAASRTALEVRPVGPPNAFFTSMIATCWVDGWME